MIESWNEGYGNSTPDAANWNERLTGTNWASNGGSYDPTIVATLNTAATGQHTWDITSLVEAWFTGSKINNGIIIGSPDGGSSAVSYDSREGSTPPVLVVSFIAPNSAPTITSNGGGSTANINVAENASYVTTVTATDVDVPAQILTFSIVGGNDAAKFTIDANSGALNFIAAPDYESPNDVGGDNVYDVIVQVDDAHGGATTQAISVAVSDIDEFSVGSISDSNALTNSVAENASSGTLVGVTAHATDPDGSQNTITYSLDDDAGGRFTIDGSSGVVSVANGALLDYETITSHSITVRATSADASFATHVFTIAVLPINDNDPVITSDGGGATAAVSIHENNTAVTTVTATDADLPAQTLSFTIIGGADASKFVIDSVTGVLSFIVAPDYESPTDVGADNVYDVVVEASDGGGRDVTQAISVSVLDINATILDQFNSISYGNNDGNQDWSNNWMESGDVGGSASGILQVHSSGYFSFGGDTVSLAGKSITRQADLTAATQATLSFLYRREDLGGGGGSITLQVSADGGISWNTLQVYNLSAFDGSFQRATFDISAYAASDTQIRFLGAGTTAAQFNLDDVQIEHNGTAINAAPIITSGGGGDVASLTVAENSTSVTALTATDNNLPVQTLSYSIIGGNDAAKFTINSVTGALRFITPVNFESPTDFGTDNVYDVIVQVSDGQGGSDQQAIAVTVTDVNEIPTIANQSFSVLENSANGTLLGSVTATDVDVGANGMLSYAITGGSGAAAFAIDSATGHVTVADSRQLDFENASSLTLVVQVTDGGTPGLNASATMTIDLLNVNESPTDISPHLYWVAENINTTGGYSLGNLAATDPDSPAPFAYSVRPGLDGSKFAIGGASNNELILTDGILDFETKNSYSVTVRATDSAGAYYDEVLTINVLNVNEAPVGHPDRFVLAGGNQLLGEGLLDNDVDVDSTTLSAILNQNPLHGSITLNPDGSFLYVPQANFSGIDIFSYVVSDGSANSSPVQVVIEVLAPLPTKSEARNPNDAPPATVTQADHLDAPAENLIGMYDPTKRETTADDINRRSIPVAVVTFNHGEAMIEQRGQLNLSENASEHLKLNWFANTVDRPAPHITQVKCQHRR